MTLKARLAIRWSSRCQSSSVIGSGLKAYSPSIEQPISEKWKERGTYSPAGVESSFPTYSSILPPPNVTGTLHLGHALSVSVGDVICRWRRMRGNEVVWIPGTDHAGIGTQAVVERDLLSRNITRHDLGRDKFIDEVWKWRNSKGQRINGQLSRLGASLDWSREYFTLDEHRSEAVTQGLIKLWDAGLVYRANSLVSWCCHLRSAISDIEVDHLSLEGPTSLSLPGCKVPVKFGQLDYFAYRLEDSEHEIVVATTRLETMLGDVAVAVHPTDNRYTQFLGKRLIHPFNGKLIPIVLDESVDPKFGTGAVKVTPAHDANDFEIALRHGLSMETVISEDGTMNKHCGDFSGLKRFEARDDVRKALDCIGLFREVRPHKTAIPICSRSGDVIEMLLKPQWFIKCGEMAKKAAEAVQNGEMVIEPDKYHKMWFSWLENIKDWCISRQLWWGHQVPFYRCTNGDGEIWVAARSVEEAIAKASKNLTGGISAVRDSDVLDTWFSSGLLPFSSLCWPHQSTDLDKYYPLSSLITGHDILFFWVARMTMLGLELTGKVPFKNVLLHSIVCDSQGRKMSKSLGNIIDPLDVIDGCSLEALNSKIMNSCKHGVISASESEKAQSMNKRLFPNGIPQCGADALRFSLLSQNIKNHYINFNVNECHGSKLFCNKIWQGHKFAHLWKEKLRIPSQKTSVAPSPSKIIDVWIMSKLSRTVDIVNDGLASSDFHVSTSALRGFLYGDICDVYIEAIKPILNSGSTAQAVQSCKILLYCFDVALRCLSPFMPYVSETLYNGLEIRSYDSMDSASYPVNLKDEEVERKMEYALSVVHFIRKLKSENGAIHRTAKVLISTDCQEELKDLVVVMNSLTKSECSVRTKHSSNDSPSDILNGTLDMSTDIFVQLEPGIPNIKKTLKCDDELTLKKKNKLESQLKKLTEMTSDEVYLKKASDKVKKINQNKIVRLQAELQRMQ